MQIIFYKREISAYEMFARVFKKDGMLRASRTDN